MEDVLEQVVGVGRGDEALDALDVPRAVVLLDGLGATGAHVGAGVGLGEDHGGAPAAFDAGGGPLLLFVGAVLEEHTGDAGPAAYMKAAGCAPSIISLTAHRRLRGESVPPISSAMPMDQYPASHQARKAFLNGSGRVTEWVSGSKTGGLRSASAKPSAAGPLRGP